MSKAFVAEIAAVEEQQLQDDDDDPLSLPLDPTLN